MRLSMKEQSQEDRLMDRKTAARYLSISPGTLAVWDCTKRYELEPIKLGRVVRYRKSSLDNFLASRLVRKSKTGFKTGFKT